MSADVGISLFRVPRRFLISSRPKWRFNKDLKKWFMKRKKGLTLHLCCGLTKFEDAINVDIDRNSVADVIADMFHLPFKDNAFDTIICDPPYKLAIHRKPFFVKELRRVASKKHGSKILLKLDFIPFLGPEWILKEIILYSGKRYWAPISLLLHYEFMMRGL